LWRAAGWKELPVGKAPEGRVISLRFGPAGKLLAVTQSQGNHQFWDVSAGKTLGRLAGYWFAAIAPDGERVVAGTLKGLVLWQPAGGKILHRFTDKQTFMHSVALSGDGKLLAGAGKGVFLWDARTAALLARFGQEKGDVGFVAFSPDAGTVLSQGPEREYPPGEKSIYLWEAVCGQVRLCLKGQRGGLTAATFSPDGRLLATAGNEQGFRLWDLASGKLAARVDGHRWRVNALAFSADGKYLASGGEDTTVLLWDVRRLVPPRRPAARLSKRRVEALWRELAGDDPEKAYRAIWDLAGDPRHVVPFLKRRLEKGPGAGPDRVRRLIAELDSDEFDTREKASAELEKLGRLVEPALRDGLDRSPSPEVTRRLKSLLRKLKNVRPGPEENRRSRVLEVLERVGTVEVRGLLKSLRTTGRAAPPEDRK
jgi:hypothetical protein